MKHLHLLLIGTLVNSVGSGLSAFGLAVFAYSAYGTASAVALVQLCAFAPIILLAPVAGALADHFDRRLMMIIGDGGSVLGLVAIILVLSTPSPRLAHILAGVAASSCLAALTEPLLDAPEEHRTELVDVYEAATALVRILLGLQDHEGAAASIELAWRVAPYVADMAAPGNGTLCDQVTLLQADMLLERGDVYGACALADAVLRRYDPCPVVLAEDARSVLVRASMKVGENEEAVTQARELLNIHLAAGMGPLAGLLFGTLAAALGAAGRSLEAAEVLETALESGMPPIIVDELRRTFARNAADVGLALDPE